MLVFVSAVDTNIFFTKEEYYIKFKGYQMKYIPRAKDGEQDSLILKMDRRMDREAAYRLVSEFVSALSYSWDAEFDIGELFSEGECSNDWGKIVCSTSGKRKISAVEEMDDFIRIHPLAGDTEVMLARLYRIAKSANPVYSQILFWWHCLCYPNRNEVQVYQHLDQQCSQALEAKQILNEPILHSNKLEELSGIGHYIYECVRHSVAHIQRKPGAVGKSFDIDSYTELQHLWQVSTFLQKLVFDKMENKLQMNKKDEPKYISYFTPNKDC